MNESRDKPALRARMREALRDMSPAAAAAASGAVCRHLANSATFAALPPRSRILSFAPLPNSPEVDLAPFARRLAASDFAVFIPRVDWAARAVTPVRVQDFDRDLTLDARGVPTVADPDAPTADSGELDLILVPGLAFDPQGFRLGRGGGFYDRFLASIRPDAPTVGVCFAAQIVERVPREPHDRAVGYLATEEGCRRVGDGATPRR